MVKEIPSMFRMRKWYADCVAADGTAVVAYWARLNWGLLRLKYAATLLLKDGIVSEAATLRAGEEPRAGPESISWSCSRLGVAGQWRPLDPPVERTLLASDEGRVEWSCLVPRGHGRVTLADGSQIEGLGYVERLDLTVRPWRLPIRELRWGRFLSDGASVVWIEWRGTRPLTILNVNGLEVAGADVGNSGVAWSTGRVELEPGAVLRKGALGATALARVAFVKLLSPRGVRELHESKRVCAGRLVTRDGAIEMGWAIDEVVRFGGQNG